MKELIDKIVKKLDGRCFSKYGDAYFISGIYFKNDEFVILAEKYEDEEDFNVVFVKISNFDGLFTAEDVFDIFIENF